MATNYVKKYWHEFVQWLAEADIEQAVNARLTALATVFPEFATLLTERQMADNAAAKAEASEREALLRKVALLDAKLAGHADFQAAVKLLTGK